MALSQANRNDRVVIYVQFFSRHYKATCADQFNHVQQSPHHLKHGKQKSVAIILFDCSRKDQNSRHFTMIYTIKLHILTNLFQKFKLMKKDGQFHYYIITYHHRLVTLCPYRFCQLNLVLLLVRQPNILTILQNKK